MTELSGRVVLITGGTDGIGLSTARSVARAGAQVLIGGRRVALGVKAAADICAEGGAATYHSLDVRDRASIREFVAEGVKRYGHVDGCVNNAGVSGTLAPLHLRSDEEDEQIFDVNLRGLYYCMKAELPALLKGGGGVIVNIGSVGSHIGMAGISSYVASKHAVLGLTRTAAIEYASHNIRINCVCPSGVRTAMADILVGADPDALAPIEAAHPLGAGYPEEIADAIVFLLTERSSYITGQSLTVDGGLTARSAIPSRPVEGLGPAVRRRSPRST
jgi:NAD(P)-dependent dehydrogenase (short-subunit alcohol dehydrogenase family)